MRIIESGLSYQNVHVLIFFPDDTLVFEHNCVGVCFVVLWPSDFLYAYWREAFFDHEAIDWCLAYLQWFGQLKVAVCVMA